MKLSRISGFEEVIGIGVGTSLAIVCTLVLMGGPKLLDMSSSIPPLGEATAAPTDPYRRAEPTAADAPAEPQKTALAEDTQGANSPVPALEAAPKLLKPPVSPQSEGTVLEQLSDLNTEVNRNPDSVPAPAERPALIKTASLVVLPRQRPAAPQQQAEARVLNATFAGAEVSGDETNVTTEHAPDEGADAASQTAATDAASPDPDMTSAELAGDGTETAESFSPDAQRDSKTSETADAARAETSGKAIGGPATPWAVIHYSGANARDAATALADRLREHGIDDVVLTEVASPITFNQLRFFHETDADIAGDVLGFVTEAAADREFKLADFTRFRPQPKDGLLEIWLKSDAE